MSADRAVEFYHSLEKFGVKPGLERIKKLLCLMGEPQNSLKFIHVAGTNGKGSVCSEIASVLTDAGYKTGLYTSPYVIDFRERIQIDNKMISPEALEKVTVSLETAIFKLAEGGLEITEFEAVTAAAFIYFAQQKCDIVVLETGLGGRFDATNIISSPLLSIISSVSLDHTAILGGSLAEIAFEKAGIIKNGSIVITSVNQPAQALEQIKKAAADKLCPIHIVSENGMDIVSEDISATYVSAGRLKLKIPFCGRHQLENTSLVLCAAEELRHRGFNISDKNIERGIANTKVPARTELISTSPLILLDGSHNDGSTAALADTLKRLLPGKRLIALMGMMADKDCSKALSHLLPCFSKLIAVSPSNPRSMPAEAFKALVEERGVECEAASSPAEGVKKAYAELENYDALIVCGSLYLAADVRDILTELSGRT